MVELNEESILLLATGIKVSVGGVSARRRFGQYPLPTWRSGAPSKGEE